MPSDGHRDGRLLGRAGGAGPRAHLPRRDARVARAVHAFLRRLPHLPRGAEDRPGGQRDHPRDDRRPLRGRAARTRALPRAPDHPRHRAELGRLLPGTRGVEPLLRRAARHRAAHDGPLRRAHRPRLPPLRLPRRAGRRARDRGDGVRLRDRARDRGRARAGGREGGRGDGAAVPSVRHFRPRRRAAGDRPRDHRPRPHEGVRQRGRAALPRRARRGGPRVPHGRGEVQAPRGVRRPLRTRRQGVRAGPREGRVRQHGREGAARRLRAWRGRRRDGPIAPAREGLPHRPPRPPRMRVLGSRLRRHGGREQELDQDHRRAHRLLRAGLFCLRLQEGGRPRAASPCRTSASAPSRS